MEKIKNFTPHSVNIVNTTGKEIATFEPEGLIRLKANTKPAGTHKGIKLTKTVFGDPEGLPKQKARTLLIVSQIVKSALPNRTDLVVPAEVQRNSSGQIIGCLSLGI